MLLCILSYIFLPKKDSELPSWAYLRV
jgi:hypothetical protein